ncbi:phage major capsid protein [Lactobacillus amylovorus]|uniref:Phage major capsid protein n=1 Tax=Lactobacillus amylovorus TaxID=1604 RepID=A0AAW6BBM7_LACAM|nr:phage major capsid protein [Lactobacillus amylovorus]MDA6088479.1 phage major capsid protein [Lactobacillus amylovorus]MDB6247132.1 phage major capsid protein [Lactobacillus amylovorus]
METKVITKDQVENTWKVAAAKVTDLNNKINIALFDDSVSTEDVNKMKAERDETVQLRDTAQEQLKQFEDNGVSDMPEKTLKKTKSKDEIDKQAVIDNINRLVHNRASVGQIMNAAGNDDQPDGLTSTIIAPTIPEQIIYNPANEVNSVVDLSSLITKTPVSTASGTSPILKRADYVFPTVEELAKNPDMAKPKFEDVNWKVSTHRGALAISNESIQDSAIDVSGMVLQQIGEARVNTYNQAISSILTAFSKADANNDNLVDAFKYLLNVALDPAYNPSIIASQTMYNALDTLKDKNGQYIFHQDVTGKSASTLLGIPVYKVGDNLLGKAGEAHAFVGDLARSIFFADRQNITLSWQYNEAYGQYLAAALRFGTVAADVNAGFFLSADIPAQNFVKPAITPTQGAKVNGSSDSSHAASPGA